MKVLFKKSVGKIYTYQNIIIIIYNKGIN